MADDTTGAIPSPRPDDDEDLVWALTTASTMWNRGDRDEAIKWVKRALEHAADNDLDDRAIELGKLVAELATKPLPSAKPPAESKKPSAAPPPPPPPAATAPKGESKKKSGLTGKHAAIRDASPAAKASARATGKHKAVGATAANAVLANTKKEPEAPAAAAKPTAPLGVPRPSTAPRPISVTATEAKRPTGIPPASPGSTKKDDAKAAPARASEVPAAATATKGEEPAATEAPNAKPAASESASPVEAKGETPAGNVVPAAASGGNGTKAPPPRPSMAPLPTRPASATTSSTASAAKSVVPPNLGASPSMRPGTLPALKAPPLPVIGKEIIVPVAKTADVAPSIDATSDRASTTTASGLLQSVRVFVTVESGGPRVALAREGASAPEGAVEAILVATHPTADLLTLFRNN